MQQSVIADYNDSWRNDIEIYPMLGYELWNIIAMVIPNFPETYENIKYKRQASVKQ